MDANGHRFWMLAEPDDFDLSDGTCQFSNDCLHLSGDIAIPKLAQARREAGFASALPPVAVGHFDDWAVYDRTVPFGTAPGSILAATNGGELSPIIGLPASARVRDMCVDEEGVLRIAGRMTVGEEGLFFVDLRGRWADPVAILIDGTAPDRVAGRWLMERNTGRLWREAGAGLADLAVRSYADHIFRPDPEYANPLRLEEQDPVELVGTERIFDCAARADGTLAVLVVGSGPSKKSMIEFIPLRGERLRLDVQLSGFASSIGWIDQDRIALTYPGSRRVVVVEVSEGENPALSVEPNRTPLIQPGSARICRGTVTPAHVVHFAEGEDRPLAHPRALQALSMPSYRNEGTAIASATIRAEQSATVWHRLVFEGELPAGTGIAIDLQVANREEDLDAAASHTHYAGEIAIPPGAPRLAWLDLASEIPLHPGMIHGAREKNRAGCFSGLVQNGETASREVKGRFARITVRLFGTGQASPAIAAIRLYASRFSLVSNYLPTVFKPPIDPAERATPGDAHPLDFLDRYTANFERALTTMEDRVAAAPALTDPMAAPSEALDWLAGWIGLVMKSGLGERQRRVMIANGMRLHRRRGTLPGLNLALDIATEGQVGSGGIVAIEDFRLRRVLATILGADLGTAYDPLLAGPVESGNSFVGNTLHLADAEEIKEGQAMLSAEQQVEIAALYRAPTDPDKLDEVRDFFAQLAWRLTVLVHHEVDEAQLGLIREIAAQMTPAHVQLRVERASKPLILGLYSLLGVDSYLRPRPGTSPIIVDHSKLGVTDQILALPSLDPAADYGGPQS
ncbi:phage tail protein [Parerythrobacter aestuarii]|uniref:phage tail protein n=1 Tax=Parerythrobacter aestuarii TaxID=3020909 RepID=UPI0024DE9156|nr:phage tail protein [Parerythrobacter aestuarii]